MTIKECIKKNGLQLEVDELKRYQSVDVDYINSDGAIDETQFDICEAGTNYGIEQLDKMFCSFGKENGYKSNTVVSVTVVSSADMKLSL